MPLDDTSISAPGVPWPAIDDCFLHATRPAPARFPLDLLGPPWRAWVDDCARSVSCPDYIVLALLGAVSAACGPRVVVEVTPHWREPAVLWLAMVGGPSTGKSPALAAAARLAEGLDDDAEAGSRDDGAATGELPPRGVQVWSDDLSRWLASASRYLAGWSGDWASLAHNGRNTADNPRAIISTLGTLQSDRVAPALSGGDAAAASRFLYAWPLPRLDAELQAAPGDRPDVRGLLLRLAGLATPQRPHGLALDDEAVSFLQSRLHALRGFMRAVEGLEGAWIGKAAGNIVRLAGLLCLMDWAARRDGPAPTTIGLLHLEQANTLWSDFFWPHAQAVFGHAGVTLADRRAREIVRWLKQTRTDVVSRAEVRREALHSAVDAVTTQDLMERLERCAVVRPVLDDGPARRGPRRRRWAVNPALLPK